MHQEPEPTAIPEAGESFSWLEVWLKAVTRPSVDTFESLLRDPNAKTPRAYLWIAISALVAYLVSLALSSILSGLLRADVIVETVWSLAICGFCGSIIVPFLSLIALLINVGLSHLCARVLGGTGAFDQLLYSVAAYQAPLTLVAGVLGVIPCVRYFTLAMALYVVVLNVIAVEAVHRFGWGKSIVCAVVVPVVIAVVVACVTIGGLTLMGPAVGNVFSTILEEMGTPMP